MDRDLIADLQRLNIEERPKNLPAELESICASVERRALDIKRFEDAHDTNSPDYVSAQAALRIAVDDLKEYRTETGWDTAKFLSDHPEEAPACKGFPCTPWQGYRRPPEGAAKFFCPVIGEYEHPAQTGVEGVNRDRYGQGWRDSEAQMMIGHVCDEELFRGINFEKHNHPSVTGVVGVIRDMPPYSGETHFRPSSIDPFGDKRVDIVESDETHFRPSTKDPFGEGDTVYPIDTSCTQDPNRMMSGDVVQQDNPEQMRRIREALKDCNIEDIKDSTPGSTEIE